LTNSTPRPRDAPVTTKTAFGSAFRTADSPKGFFAVAKSISLKTGVPFVPGGAPGKNSSDVDILLAVGLKDTAETGRKVVIGRSIPIL
jgi:hypothetical protein